MSISPKNFLGVIPQTSIKKGGERDEGRGEGLHHGYWDIDAPALGNPFNTRYCDSEAVTTGPMIPYRLKRNSAKAQKQAT